MVYSRMDYILEQLQCLMYVDTGLEQLAISGNRGCPV